MGLVMAKKDKAQYKQEKEITSPSQESTELEAISKLPTDVQEKLKTIKTKLEKFQKKVLEKFDKYIVGIALMPPPKPEELQQLQQMQSPQAPLPEPKPEDKDKIHVLVLVDDSDSRTMSKLELRDKLTAIVASIGTEVDPNITPQPFILLEQWQNGFAAKLD